MMIIILFLTLSNIFDFNCAQHQTNLLADIVKSRCTHWKIEHGATNINCSEIWNSFENILISPAAKSQCPMKPKSYDDFVYQLFELEQQQLRQQQSTIQTEYYFHSQVMEVIRGMCKRLGMCRSLETTLPGWAYESFIIYFYSLHFCYSYLSFLNVYANYKLVKFWL
ncbi:unnamed protein product [Schistosoma bovis]|nr:unnamed protein product [Schistosoma bovis]